MARKKGKFKESERIIVKSVEDDVWPNYSEYDGQKEMHIGNDLFTLDITDMDDGCFSCATLKIRGQEADIDDFGNDEDIDPQHAPPWGCGNRFFQVWEERPEILEKYGITVEEYDEIGFWLQRCLSVGCCDLCA